jgi:tetratricopeptide (TPR) repeat protein
MERRNLKKKILKVILIIVIGTGIYLSLLLINPENIKKVRDQNLKGKKQKGYFAFQLIQDSISKFVPEEETVFSTIITKADSFFCENKFKEAESLYIKAHRLSIKLKDKQLGGLALMGKGAAIGRQENYSKAIDIFMGPLEYKGDMENEALTQLYFNIGASYHMLGEKEDAIKYYSKAIQIDPKSARAYHNRGLIYAGKENYEKAIKDFSKAIKIKPRFALFYNQRGVTYASQKKYDKAEADYLKVIELDPNYGTAYYNLGNLYMKRKKYDKALQNYTQIERKALFNTKSEYSHVFINKALIYYELKEYDKAIENFSKGLKYAPKSASSSTKFAKFYFFRALSYAHKEEFNKAIEDLNKSIEINPGFTEAKKTLNEIKKLKKASEK